MLGKPPNRRDAHWSKSGGTQENPGNAFYLENGIGVVSLPWQESKRKKEGQAHSGSTKVKLQLINLGINNIPTRGGPDLNFSVPED
jgi:hypothetical protein